MPVQEQEFRCEIEDHVLNDRFMRIPGDVDSHSELMSITITN